MGGLVGRMDIPRLGVSMIVAEGTAEATLRLGPSTPAIGMGEVSAMGQHRTDISGSHSLPVNGGGIGQIVGEVGDKPVAYAGANERTCDDR